MIKEKKQFIFGLSGLIFCTFGIIIGILRMQQNLTTSFFVFNILYCILEIVGMSISAYYIIKNIIPNK